MKKHHDFKAWAIANGISMNGIAAHRFPGRGVGIIATKKLEAGQLLLSIPSSALWTVHTVSKSISKHLEGVSVHGLLAADLSFDESPVRASWRAVVPPRAELFEAMPFRWDPALQKLLTPAAGLTVKNQNRKFLMDWKAVSNAFPTIDQELFLYNWLLVNTRTFYWTPPGMKRFQAPDDCMALNPFADYFNHADVGCPVKFDSKGFQVLSQRDYQEQEEIFISYGSHSNDFLLAEYGFILPENKWDEVQLDHVIVPELSEQQRKKLEDVGFMGGYVLDRYAVCHRTQVALRILCVSTRSWRQFVRGEDDGEADLINVDKILLKMLNTYREQVRDTLIQISEVTVGEKSQRQILSRRWNQVLVLLGAAINRIEKS